MLSFTTYVLYAYVLLPLIHTAVRRIIREPKICATLQSLQCLPETLSCAREYECEQWINQIRECMKPNSNEQQKPAERFAHIQHPEDAVYYQCFDRPTTNTALNLLECIGRSIDCKESIERATYSDLCADADILQQKLAFETIPASVWQGKWQKLYTTARDLWPCQWIEFSPPQYDDNQKFQPESWMTKWPKEDNVWRMDLTWQFAAARGVKEEVKFYNCNEMYPRETWDFLKLPPNNRTTPEATLKTRDVTWGTETHANWYLLHYDEDKEIMLLYYCGYTEADDQLNSMAMVLQKEGSAKLSEEDSVVYEQTVKGMLGPIHGKLQRIPECMQ